MKKIALFISCVMLLSMAVFADDAKVLPAGVIRTTIAPTYAFQQGGYDIDGEFTASEEGDGSVSFLNLGFALEYGVNDFITAAVQWAPGVNVWSKIDNEMMEDANVNGMFDLFVGAKIQIVGEKAPSVSESLRFAVAPGLVIPMPGPDFDEELDNAIAGDPYTIAELDNKSFGLGGRFYADYIVNSSFFINAYAEYIYYLERTDYKALVPFFGVVDVDSTQAGSSLVMELEPHFEAMVSDGVTFGAGLPVRYTMIGESKFDGEAVEDTGSTLMSIAPNVSIFLMKAAVPTEIALQYNMPLSGTNNTAVHSITLKIKNFLKF